MKRITLILTSLLFLSYYSYSQNQMNYLIGRWTWCNKNLTATILFDSTNYFIDVSSKDNITASISKVWFKYKIKGDTILFYERDKEKTYDKLNSKYYIKVIEKNYMELVDPKGELDKYYKTSSLSPIIPKEK